MNDENASMEKTCQDRMRVSQKEVSSGTDLKAEKEEIVNVEVGL